ncbi:MAG: DUF4360 domain-containing protein [Bdellovibrionota bacterium]
MRVKMKLMGLLVSLSWAMNAYAYHDVPDLDDVWISNVAAGGTGCKGQEGAYAYFDGQAIVLQTEGLNVIKGERIPASEARKFCQYLIELEVPSGWTYGIVAVEGNMETYLNYGTKAVAKLNASFVGDGDSGAAEIIHKYTGYDDTNFYERLDQVIYAPCDNNRSLKLKQALQLSKASSSRTSRRFSEAQLDSPVSFYLTWKRCGGVIRRDLGE